MQWFKRVCVSLATAAVLAAGCSKSADQVAEQAVAQPGVRTLLQRIPADTPFVMVGLGGSVRPFIAKLSAGMGPAFDQLSKMLDQMPGTGDPAKDKIIRAVLAELRGMLSVEGIERLGFDIDGHWAIYGLGVLPAMRWTLKDPDALRAAIGRIEQNAEAKLPTCKLGDLEYWCGGDAKFKVAAAIVDRELVLGAAPAGLEDRVFGLLLGRDAPPSSLADTPRLREVLGAWELGRYGAGFVDVKAIAEAALGEGDPLTRDVLAALSPELASEWPQLTQVCKDEVRGLVAQAPRMVVGTESLGAGGFEGLFALELDPVLASELRALRAAVPGLQTEVRDASLFAFGVGLDLGKALEFALRRAQAVQKSPFQCPDLAPLNRLAEDMIKDASSQLPPFVSQLRGFSFALQDLKMAGYFPSVIQGYAVVATADPKGLHEYAKTQAPLLAQYSFTDDGAPVTLPDGTVPFVNGIAYAARAGRGIAVAVGPGSEDKVKALLAEGEVQDPPVMLFSYDLGRLMGQLGDLAGASGSAEMTALFSLYKSFGPSGYTLHAGERGLVMRTGLKLRD